MPSRHIGRVRQPSGRRRGSWHNLDLVFLNTVGKPLGAEGAAAPSFYPLLEKAKLPEGSVPRSAAQHRDAAAGRTGKTATVDAVRTAYDLANHLRRQRDRMRLRGLASTGTATTALSQARRCRR
jgi:hypothetical protein